MILQELKEEILETLELEYNITISDLAYGKVLENIDGVYEIFEYAEQDQYFDYESVQVACEAVMLYLDEL